MLTKNQLFEILLDWNYWNRNFPKTTPRKSYEKKIEQLSQTDEVVVIKGVRRCGKSTLLLNEMKRLVASGVPKEQLLFVNFEDVRLIGYLGVELLNLIKDTYMEFVNPQGKPTIFLDEIQNIKHWEKWVNTEYELKKSYIFVTGSNSSMLSSEIGTALSGRYVSVDVYPLSFKEFLLFKEVEIKSKMELISQKYLLNREFRAFISEGGFPKSLEYSQNKIMQKELIEGYFNSILLKDIVARFKLKNFKILEDLSAFLLSNTATYHTINKLKNSFAISYDMARDYMEYLEKAYMILAVNKFDYSLKKQQANARKYYSIDLGLSNLLRVPNIKTKGHDLESVVLLELLRRGYKVYYYKTKGDLECDFVVEKNREIVELIQVTVSLRDEKTRKRELAPFAKVVDELNLKNVKLTVLCEDSSESLDDGIEIVNVLEWLVL
ncbi:MAG: ATPase component BioM of energizing module of biotin ECF transporter [uncultured Sulfurovum sp.]|uniref:ATPase component BioM of energizing module of biotin ECF transporter n=1 Tax=uncultured Sulfurovum sp. TaxID=269237 RepID=A0A6S6SX97_9BACT|nr:MAG: ATPase component BioM of energizing module of biotin ECF transporter [uncultured Sulfurovum sp.]